MVAKTFGLDTLAIHAGQEPDPASGAVMTPIVLSSTFAQDGPGKAQGLRVLAQRTTRRARRSRRASRRSKAASHGFAFASGCARDHHAPAHARAGRSRGVRRRRVRRHLPHVRQGDAADRASNRRFVDMTDPAGSRARPAAEDPHDLARDADQSAAQDLRHRRDRRRRPRRRACPSSSTTRSRRRSCSARSSSARRWSCTRRPSTSTATPTWSAARSSPATRALAERLRFLQNAIGAVPSPFDCYLVLRGLKTLPRAHAPARRRRPRARRAARAAPERPAGLLPGPAEPPAARALPRGR